MLSTEHLPLENARARLRLTARTVTDNAASRHTLLRAGFGETGRERTSPPRGPSSSGCSTSASCRPRKPDPHGRREHSGSVPPVGLEPTPQRF